MRRLIEIGDNAIREELSEYYYVSQSRMDNILNVIERGAIKIKELTKIIETQQEEIKTLSLLLASPDKEFNE